MAIRPGAVRACPRPPAVLESPLERTENLHSGTGMADLAFSGEPSLPRGREPPIGSRPRSIWSTPRSGAVRPRGEPNARLLRRRCPHSPRRLRRPDGPQWTGWRGRHLPAPCEHRGSAPRRERSLLSARTPMGASGDGAWRDHRTAKRYSGPAPRSSPRAGVAACRGLNDRSAPSRERLRLSFSFSQRPATSGTATSPPTTTSSRRGCRCRRRSRMTARSGSR
jgi:hypothetical protein